MKEVFLIMNNPCDYESQPSAIGFKETEEEAQVAVQALTERHNRLCEMREEFDNIFVLYNKENPFDAGILSEKKIRTPWPPGLGKNQITQEMREEKEKIKEFNKAIDEERLRRYGVWESKRTETLRPIIESKPKEFQNEIEFGIRGYYFTSVPWLHKEQPYFFEKLHELIIK